MARHIPAYNNANKPIVDVDGTELQRSYFNLVKLDAGEEFEYALAAYESVCVVLSGTLDMEVNGEEFESVGKRESVWDGNADSVYAPPGAVVRLRGVAPHSEIAVAGGACRGQHADQLTAFRVAPEDVDSVDVGSRESHSRRAIRHILGKNAEGRAGNLLVSELYCDEGCWSGYPPHKHDESREGETAHEEVYHYRFDPETGFGGQFAYDDAGNCDVFKTGHGDTVLIASGYHPTVTSPGHREYIFTILVGRDQRSLVQYFHKDQQHLMASIPGIDAMRAKFK